MSRGDPHPPGFSEKSLQSIENKGRTFRKERQESSRVRKRLEVKEIEEVGNARLIKHAPLLPLFFISVDSKPVGRGPVCSVRVFTSYDRADCRSCQYIKWVLVFRDWAQTKAGARAET